MIEVVLDEADIAIKTAYQEGYKAGVLAWKTEADYWKYRSEQLQVQIKGLDKTKWLYGLSGFGLGFLTGGATTFAIGFKININPP